MTNRCGYNWDKKEEQELLHRFWAGYTLTQIMHLHERTRGGIESRLVMLGLQNMTAGNPKFFDGHEPGSQQWHANGEGSVYMGNAKSVIKGRFWMIQNGELSGETDAFGQAKVDWPGKSVFDTKAKAVEAAKVLAAKYVQKKFYIMEAVCLYETALPPVRLVMLK